LLSGRYPSSAILDVDVVGISDAVEQVLAKDPEIELVKRHDEFPF